MDKANRKKLGEEFELLRSGISDQVNLLADDELSELFGGYQCGKNFCAPRYSKNDCEPLYCGSDFVF